MIKKRIVFTTMLIIICLPMFALPTTGKQELIEVEYFVGGLRIDWPPCAEYSIGYFNRYCEAALEYGIQINLVYAEVPFGEEFNTRFTTGNYDIIEGVYWTEIDGLDNFEVILTKLEIFFIDGLVHYDTQKYPNVANNIAMLRTLYDEYLNAEPEQQECLLTEVIHRFHKIEKILYKIQIVQYDEYFTFLNPFAGLIWERYIFFNSEPGRVLNNERIRLILSYITDRVDIAYCTSILPYPYEEIVPTCHMFAWSQYHDTSLPFLNTPIHGW